MFDGLVLSRRFNSEALRQNAAAIWFTGLSGAGKTTLSVNVHRRLADDNFFSVILDGDEMRQGLNAGLGFSQADRGENIRRTAEVCSMYLKNGIICIVSTISPYPELRANAREIIGKDRFIEVYLNAPLSVCEQRDVKGFYKKARKNEIADFTGIQDQYIAPDNPDLEIRTDRCPIEDSVEQVYCFVRQRIAYPAAAVAGPAIAVAGPADC